MLNKIFGSFPVGFFVVVTALAAVILVLSVRGNPGNPSVQELNTLYWKEDGPFELSPERGRFILTYSLLENSSFQFSEDLARFGAPDVAVTHRGEYASLFAPTMSFVTMPGFVLGKIFGLSQVGTFLMIAVFALINLLLIVKIATKLGANIWISTLAGLIFLFGTPAFAYGVNLYQHHISTALILGSIYLLVAYKNFWSLFLVFLLCALALTVDYPNLFMMFPIGLVALSRLVSFKLIKEKLTVKFNMLAALSVVGLVFPMIFFLWFNYQSYHSAFQLSGTLPAIRDLDEGQIKIVQPFQGAQPVLEKTFGEGEKTAVGFFKTRNLTQGLYTHFLSPDRGIIFYTPVMLLSVLGMYLAYKKNLQFTALLIAIMGANIILYSMWSDPWGGWAFGSRYLIPTYAIAAVFIALFLTYYKKLAVVVLAFMLFAYSAFVNTAGALSTSANPPEPEVLALEEISGTEQKYTYARNLDYLANNGSKAVVYRVIAHDFVDGWGYFLFIYSLIMVLGIGVLLVYLVKRKEL